MQKDIRVLIVEDDPYARDLMSLLLTRDWRTRVIGEATGKQELIDFLDQPGTNVDILILDTEIPGEPELLKVLPRAINSGWTLRRDRVGFFRSHLVLNSLYYLSHQNILNLDHSAEAVTAAYEKALNEGTSKRVRVLFVKYASPQRALKGLNDFHSAYLEEHPKGFVPTNTHKQEDYFSIEDGWLGYALNGTGLTVVFECPDRETAELIVKHISSEAINKGIKHEK